MSSTLISCGICGTSVRFPGGQPVPSVVVCERDTCQAELARQVAAATVVKPEPVKKARK